MIDYFAMKKVSSNKIYNMKFILFLSILVVTLSLLSLLLYDVTPIARYVIILVIGIVIFIFRKKVIEIFKVVKKG